MKKFYFSILSIAFLLVSAVSKGQYVSILDNSANNYTFDDGRFWQGGVPPGSGPEGANCTGCNIVVYSSVTVTDLASTAITGNGPWLLHVTLDGATLRIQGPGTVFTINTYVSLINGTQILIGTDPAYNESIVLNDQVDMDLASSVRIGNNNSFIDALNLSGHTLQGTIPTFANGGTPDAGIFSLLATPDMFGNTYSLVLNENGQGTEMDPADGAFYTWNCSPTVPAAPIPCNTALIVGPAITGADPLNPNSGILFTQSTTLPVQLVLFLASKNDDGTVAVKWATSQEQNSNYYDVERSSDQSGWIKIGTVKAKGFSSITSNYNFTDNLPLSGSSYYRLKMVDLDAKFLYSKTVSLSSNKTAVPLV